MLPATFRRFLVAVTVIGAVASATCSGYTSTAPSSNAVVTFLVQNETFRVSLNTAGQVAAARAAQAGGQARIPIGRIASGTGVNDGWSWHLEDLEFGESAIEVCDGRPSDVERQGTRFGAGSFCPWTASILRIDDR
jgi:hypothetical protein